MVGTVAILSPEILADFTIGQVKKMQQKPLSIYTSNYSSRN
jgi:hypothetical protein